MAEYTADPFSYINPASFGRLDEMSSPEAIFYASQKANAAQPFIERMGQEQELGLQEKQQKVQEFMSPEGIAARQAKQQWETAENRGKIQSEPSAIQARIAESNAKIATAGKEAQAKVDKMLLDIDKLKGTQEEGFLKALSDYGVQLSTSKADPLTKIDNYHRMIEHLKKQFPKATVDSKLATWNAYTETNLEILNNGFLKSLAQKQALELQEKQEKARLEQIKEQGKTSRAVAGISAGASERNAALAYGTREEQNQIRQQEVIRKAVENAVKIRYPLGLLGANTQAEKDAIEKDIKRIENEVFNRYQITQRVPKGIPQGSKLIPGKVSRNGKPLWSPDGGKTLYEEK